MSGTSGSRSSLTRRRSLVQTPGLATRNSSIEDRRRTWNSWKAQNITPEHEAKWSPSNRNLVLETVEDSQHTPAARAQTPSDMDYSQLGSIKIGSLVCVNPSASPVPSPAHSSRAKLQQRSRVPVDDDYFSSAPDDSSSPLTMKNKGKRGHVKSKSSVLPAPAPIYVAELDSTNDQGVPHTANQYAEGYQAELLHSPFATAHTFGSATALASTIFDAPTTAIDTTGSSLFAATSPESFTVSAPETASHQRTTKLSQRPTPRTSDSGYSSNGSLRRRTEVTEQSVASTKPGKAKRYYAHQSANLPSLSIPDGSEKLSETIISPQSINSAASKSSVDGANSTQRRLQKRRKSQPDLPAVQSCISTTDSVIPEIPNSIKAKFNRRLSHQPGMDALVQTYPTKDHVTIESSSKDYTTSNTCGLEQQSYREDRQACVNDVREVVQLAEIEPTRPPTPPPQTRRRSRSLFRRKSTVETEPDKDFASASIVDFGTIATSLGSSPYDAAMSRPLRNSITSPTHPHQLGATLARPKSMVGMDSEVAVEFARLRSKDRALTEQEDKPKQRRRSFHNLKMDAGEAKASKHRPQSFLHDAPPVPTIDSAKHGVYVQDTVSGARKQHVNEHIARSSDYAVYLQDTIPAARKQDTNEDDLPLSARPRLERGMDRTENSSFSTASRGGNQRVSQLVGRYDQPQAVNWEAHSQAWSQRRKSIGEGLRSHAGFGEASASSINSRNMPQHQPRQHLVDRYSGGLQYGYEGGGTFHGSAGTRQLHSTASSKSLQWRNQYGVDLSDVPIMLQRAD